MNVGINPTHPNEINVKNIVKNNNPKQNNTQKGAIHLDLAISFFCFFFVGDEVLYIIKILSKMKARNNKKMDIH